jgi:hypothetical protein
VLCAGFVAVAIAGALAITAATSGRVSVYSQLQRPASFSAASVGPGPVATSIDAQPYQVKVTASPNKASRNNRLSVVITRGGRPLDAARVTVTYSMNAMNMFNVFTGKLAQTARGTYSATQPVFGMPGEWDLRFDVTPAHGARMTLAVADRMLG